MTYSNQGEASWANDFSEEQSPLLKNSRGLNIANETSKFTRQENFDLEVERIKADANARARAHVEIQLKIMESMSQEARENLIGIQ